MIFTGFCPIATELPNYVHLTNRTESLRAQQSSFFKPTCEDLFHTVIQILASFTLCSSMFNTHAKSALAISLFQHNIGQKECTVIFES